MGSFGWGDFPPAGEAPEASIILCGPAVHRKLLTRAPCCLHFLTSSSLLLTSSVLLLLLAADFLNVEVVGTTGDLSLPSGTLPGIHFPFFSLLLSVMPQGKESALAGPASSPAISPPHRLHSKWARCLCFSYPTPSHLCEAALAIFRTWMPLPYLALQVNLQSFL